MSMTDNRAAEPIEVTVTHLEMDRPPARYPAMPYNPERHIALLRCRDIPLHFYRYLIDRVGRKWHWVNALRMDEEELEATIRAPDRDIRVLYVEGCPAGFFDVNPQAQAHCELAYFGLMEHAIGQGLGHWFLGAAVEACWSHDPQVVAVQTCTLDHPAALPLYQKMGFVPVGQSRETVAPLSPRERADILLGQ